MGRFFDAGQEAHGFIAIGQVATGFIAIGQSALGVIAIGQLARGGIAIGQASFGIISVGMVSGGLFSSYALAGIAGRKGEGFVFEVIPQFRKHRVLPPTTSAPEVWSSGEAGWVRAEVVRDPKGHPALFDQGHPLQVKLTRPVRSPAAQAIGSDVLAYTSRVGDVLVCERLMATTSTPTFIADEVRYVYWAVSFVVLTLIATAYWLVVGFPLIRGLVELG